MRGVGVTPWLTETLGPFGAPFAVVTQLADFWFAALAVLLAYWLGERAPVVGGLDRRRAALLVALLVGAAGLTTTLKAAFALPRPPTAAVPPPLSLPAALQPVYEWAATADSFGFPSGHAVTATVLWGGFAWALDRGRRRTRLAVAGGAVALVGFSRLALGVHYLVDVVAGVAVGLVYLAAVLRLGSPTRAFGLAVAVAVPAPLLAAGTDPQAVAGLAVGTALAWLAVRADAETLPDPPLSVVVAATALVAVPALVVLRAGLATPALTVLGSAVAGAVVVALPLVGHRVEKAW